MRETGSMSKCLKPCRGISGNTKIKARNYIKELKRSPRSRFSIRRSRSRRGRIFRSRFRRPIKFSRNRSIRRRFGKLRTKSIKRFTKKVTRSKSTKSKGVLSYKKAFARGRKVGRRYYLSTTYHYHHWNWYYNHYHFYPYYMYYWYFYGHYHTLFPQYYHYYLHNHPVVFHAHFSRNVYYFHHHHPVLISFRNISTIAKKRHTIKRCEKGPKHLLNVKHKGRNYRIFLGDVNDFVNVACLYFMDSVVSVGKKPFVKRIKKLYSDKKAKIKVKGGKSLKIDPFKNAAYKPSNPKVKKLNKNSSRLTFKIANKGKTFKTKKSLLFVHLFNNQIKGKKDVKRVFKLLTKHSKKGKNNVLFIADHLQPKSIYVLQKLLEIYKKKTIKYIAKITYRRFRIFYHLLHHHHHHHHHPHHHHVVHIHK